VKTYPVVFVWRKVDVVCDDGEIVRQLAMVPMARYGNVCARQFAEGEDYPLVIQEERSMASHKQYFAAINDGFHNLPEKIAARYPSAEHLRKWLLIETNWHEEKEFPLTSEKAAKSLCTFIRAEDDYVRIFQRGSLVIVRKAKSQSMAAMGKEAFEKSKRDVLDLLEAMISVPRNTLMKEAGKSA
jgi:hypothetical protein